MNQDPLPQYRSDSSPGKPKLLIVELWGMGDLVIATPFLQAASEKYDLSLLAKPFALDLQPRLWPGIKIFPFTAPWTAFEYRYKYNLGRWPIREILRLRRNLAKEHFDYGLSGRWDPRDHFLLQMVGVRERLGFPRLKSEVFLSHPLTHPGPLDHHYEYWRIAGRALGISLPPREKLTAPTREFRKQILVHSGARLPARVWPLEQYQDLVRRLRREGRSVQVACDPNQLASWQKFGEAAVICPRSVNDLLALIDQSGVFIGNCSGPGHLAAIIGLPTFTFFGPSLFEWFAPLHPAAEWIEGRACPYKPCSDYCRFSTPECLWMVTAEEAWPRVRQFVQRHLSKPPCQTGVLVGKNP
jgi:heptosyltransferase-2